MWMFSFKNPKYNIGDLKKKKKYIYIYMQDTFAVQLKKQMYYRAREGSDIFPGFHQAKK